ncbi:MAG: hypothetical protein FWF86_03000 [Clostridia bacterium]|nr:hypothetical protein [Clostridia bacterium]
MNGRELLLCTLRGERTPRIPVAPFIHHNFIDEFFEQHGCDGVEKGIEVYEHFGFDIILRTCSVGGYLDETICDSPEWRVSQHTEDVRAGDTWRIVTTVQTPEKTLRQVKQFAKVYQYETVEAIVEYYIKDKDDFDQFQKYQPALPALDCGQISKARRLLEKKGLTAPWVQGAFNMTSMYRKLDDLLTDAYLQPELYDAMMRYFSDRALAASKQFVNAGADMISGAGNAANGGTVGPAYFQSHILPYERDFAHGVKSLGVYYLYHNCGDSRKLLPLYPDIGMDMYESLTPPPYGDADLDEAFTAFSGPVTLSGNFDQIHALRHWSGAEIEEGVRTVMAKAKERGRFIFATTDYFNEKTPHDKIKIFAEAARKYGNYE